MTNHSDSKRAHVDPQTDVREKKAYTAPRLTVHGSLEAITKGGIDPVPPLGWIS